MGFTHDRLISIAVGQSRTSLHWQTQQMLWSEFVAKFAKPIRTTETFAEYKSWAKGKQDNLKDVGGFVGGAIVGERRKPGNVTGRDVITLDADSIPPGGTQAVIDKVNALGCAYLIYSTRKHEGGAPRLRIVFLLDKTVGAEQYEPLARKMGEFVGLPIMDPTTFEVSRLMYWASTSCDGEYVFVYADKPMLSAEGILAQYEDWTDVSQWAQVPGEHRLRERSITKQGDPLSKSGVVGAFCRNYDIVSAMHTFIPLAYTACVNSDRYTYIEGSTSGGAVLYDDGKFLFSHHATDPCSGRLVNAFDMVRLHRFADADDDAKEGTPTVQLPSYKAMLELAVGDKAVASSILQERQVQAQESFATPVESTEWMRTLDVSPTTGAIRKTIANVMVVLRHDEELKGKIKYNSFNYRTEIHGQVPWNKKGGVKRWDDNDDAGLRHYLESRYDLTGKDRIVDALSLVAQENAYHPIQDYLYSLPLWDSIKRLDTLLVDYFGAEDNAYTKAVTRKAFTAAVARVFVPGTKFDSMLVLTGKQGAGKTTLLAKMGGAWHLECGVDVKGKETAELLQGKWLVEFGELKGMSRAEVNDIKQFLSRTTDSYRPTYGRNTVDRDRQCVFFGTTNDTEYLRDTTGNRRFFPVDLGVTEPTKDIFTQLEDDIPLLWAEALARWQCGEPLYLEGEEAKYAEIVREQHVEVSPKEGAIREFLERKIPKDWYDKSTNERRMYWGTDLREEGTEERAFITVSEIWNECFGKNVVDLKRMDSNEITNVLKRIDGWVHANGLSPKGGYGRQKGFKRVQPEE